MGRTLIGWPRAARTWSAVIPSAGDCHWSGVPVGVAKDEFAVEQPVTLRATSARPRMAIFERMMR